MSTYWRFTRQLSHLPNDFRERGSTFNLLQPFLCFWSIAGLNSSIISFSCNSIPLGQSASRQLVQNSISFTQKAPRWIKQDSFNRANQPASRSVGRSAFHTDVINGCFDRGPAFINSCMNFQSISNFSPAGRLGVDTDGWIGRFITCLS